MTPDRQLYHLRGAMGVSPYVPPEKLTFSWQHFTMVGVGLKDNDVIRMHEVGLLLTNVTHVAFANNDLTDKCLHALEALLSTWPKLEVFVADDNKITELFRDKTWKSKYPTLFRVLHHRS